jgi:Holliday junction DNA helicase RuvA
MVSRDADGTLEVETAGGVVYEVSVPLTVLQRLPIPPAVVELRTYHAVKEDSQSLFGFLERGERELFGRLLLAKGVGTKVALNLLSTYPAARLARAIAEKDVAALKQVSGVGKKTAEQIVLELSDKVSDLAVSVPAGSGSGAVPAPAQEAVAALVALGFGFGDADAAVRAVLENGGADTAEDLIRKALANR